MLPRKPTDQHS